MRYHLWFVCPSRNRPLGVRDSIAVTGETGLSPTAPVRFGRLLQGVIHLTLLSSVTPTRKLSEQVHARLLILFFAVCKL